jgi:hypothetical protein
MASILRAMQYVLTEGKTLHEPHIKPLLTALKHLSMLGTLSHEPPPQLQQERRAGRKKKQTDESSSDSEQSDSDPSFDRFNSWKVRLHALSCIMAIAKASPKSFYGFWNLFIPNSPHSSAPSIFGILLHDPSPKVRSTSAATLATIFDGSSNFLLAAADMYVTSTVCRTVS